MFRDVECDMMSLCVYIHTLNCIMIVVVTLLFTLKRFLIVYVVGEKNTVPVYLPSSFGVTISRHSYSGFNDFTITFETRLWDKSSPEYKTLVKTDSRVHLYII